MRRDEAQDQADLPASAGQSAKSPRRLGERMRKAKGILSAVFAALFAILLGLAGTYVRDAKAGPPQETQVPKFEVDPFWPKPLPELWVTGEVGGTCVDGQDHVFVLNRDNLTSDEQRNSQPAPPVVEYDADGNIVNSWGKRIVRDGDGNSLARGAQDTLPKRLHACVVDPENNIWIGGNQDGIIQKYTHDGSKLLLQIGTAGQLDTSDGTPTGYAMNSSQTMLNRPASMAIDPTNGDIYVADGYGNRRVVVFNREDTSFGSGVSREQLPKRMLELAAYFSTPSIV